jgi:hypothetical protein
MVVAETYEQAVDAENYDGAELQAEQRDRMSPARVAEQRVSGDAGHDAAR